MTFMFKLAVTHLGQITCASDSKGDVRQDNSQRRFLAQAQRCNAGTML